MKHNTHWSVAAFVKTGSVAALLSLVLGLPLTSPALATDAAYRGSDPKPGQLDPPASVYDVSVTKDVMISMRDGVRLATDLYRPEGITTGPLPTILYVMGGYAKAAMRPDPTDRKINSQPNLAEWGDKPWFEAHGISHNVVTWLASQGYAVAVQDARGRYQSEGEYQLTKNYPNDIYDTIDWLVKQEWSNGKLGTLGCSYGGEVQHYIAPSAHPALKAMIPESGGSGIGSADDRYAYAHGFDTGALAIASDLAWYQRRLAAVRARPPENITREQWDALRGMYDLTPKIPEQSTLDWGEILQTLPELDLAKRAGLEVGGVEQTEWRKIVSHMNDVTAPFWKDYNYIKEGSVNNVPTLQTTGWNDIDPRTELYLRDMYEKSATSDVGRQNQFIIVSPAEHCGGLKLPSNYKLGDLELGDPRFGIASIYLSWFDHWLKGINNHVTDMPKIQYYTMGINAWRASNTWPPSGTVLTKLYLRSNGRANTSRGDGKLSFEPPRFAETPDKFVYDPANPVRTAAGVFSISWPAIADQRPNGARQDVLVYTTPVLQDGLEITGNVDADIFLSSNVRDTDLVLTLIDVYPDGRALNISESLLRVRYRNGRSRPEPMEVGRIYKVPIRLGATSMFLKPGHRLRLHLTSSSFPNWGRNLNTGGPNFNETKWVVATNVIYHAPDHASYIQLPIAAGQHLGFHLVP